MIRNPQQIKLMALGLPAVPANGGGKSESSNQTTTTSADQRNNVSSGVGATASSGASVVLNVNQLDGGAIAQSFGLAHDALANATQFGTAALSASSHTAELAINGVLNDATGARQAYENATQQVQTAYSDANNAVAAAYQDAKTGNQKTLMVGAMIVAALAVSMPFMMREAA
jgi:hypothetical protein